MALHELNPLGDSRWDDLVQRHAAASMFHSPAWLEALQRTYRYEPVVFTDSAPSERLSTGIVFCRVNSWLTGRRLVSLPFSDHCEPLVTDRESLSGLLSSIAERREDGYVELRPVHAVPNTPVFGTSEIFWRHTIDLRPSLTHIFRRFDRNHIQRAIRKAERLGVKVESGRAAPLLDDFYRLHRQTRQRHRVPVQPFTWFKNLIECLRDSVTLWVATFEERAVAAMITTTHARTVMYKYGCSDEAFHRLSGTPLLFCRVIEDSKQRGFDELDLGRTDFGNNGLIAFKDRLGGERRELTYYRCSSSRGSAPAHVQGVAKAASRAIPSSIRTRLGTHLYKHFA